MSLVHKVDVDFLPDAERAFQGPLGDLTAFHQLLRRLFAHTELFAIQIGDQLRDLRRPRSA